MKLDGGIVITPHYRQAILRSTFVGFTAAALMLASGCGKKPVRVNAPAAPALTGNSPTATLTASPTAVAPGQQVTLNWRTTDATDVSIDGIGPVETAGIKSVTPTQSTDYHLVARGPGGSTDATARVTVTNGSAMTESNTGDSSVDDAMFHTNVQDVFFDYDAYDVRPDEQPIISKDVQFLTAHPALKIVVGGYCDDRGSTEYNLALGENRANAVKQALVAAGIGGDRIRTVSYGKEKQFCTEENEQCWQQNRRAGFSVDR
jgi:peptidoglycan-associated lipoprotein